MEAKKAVAKELRAENARLKESLRTLLSHYGDARELMETSGFVRKGSGRVDTPAMTTARAALAGSR